MNRLLLVFYLLGSVPAFAGQSAPGVDKNASLSAEGAEIVGALLALHEESSDETGRLWPGFSPLYKPVVIYLEGAGMVALNYPGRPAGFRKLSYPATGIAVYAGPAGEAVNIGAEYRQNYDLGGISTFYYRYSKSVSVEAAVKTITHETFHSYQRAVFKNMAVIAQPAKANTDNNYRESLEHVFLAKALLGGENWREHLKTFITLREDRYAREDKETLAWERFIETLEGTAEYVGWRAIRGKEKMLPSVLDAEESYFLLAYMSLNKSDMATKRRSSAYGTGMAQCLLMDRIRIPWRQRVERGERIFDVLREYFPERAGSGEIKQIVSAYKGIQGEMEEENKRTEQRAAFALKQERDFKGWRLVIKGLRFTDFGGVGGVTIPGPEGELVTGFSVFETYGNHFRISARNTSVVRRTDGALEVLLEEDPQIYLYLNGEKHREVPHNAGFKNILMDTAKFSCDIKKSGTVGVYGKTITLTMDVPLPPGAQK